MIIMTSVSYTLINIPYLKLHLKQVLREKLQFYSQVILKSFIGELKQIHRKLIFRVAVDTFLLN